MTSKLLSSAALILLASWPSAAQQFEAGASFQLSLPQGEFKRNVDRPGLGGNLYAGYAPLEQPLFVGLRGGLVTYGFQDTKDIIYGPLTPIDGEVSTENSIFSLQLLVRLQPNEGAIRPFLECFAGWNHLYTKTSIRESETGEEIDSETNLSDDAFCYGGGGGVEITVFRPDDPGQTLKNVSILLSAGYTLGGRAKYLKEGSIRRIGESVVFTSLESTTDLLSIALGVTVHL